MSDQNQPLAADYAYFHAGVILCIPADIQPRDIIKALQALERMALEDYTRRAPDPDRAYD